jgi:hypothetical protein
MIESFTQISHNLKESIKQLTGNITERLEPQIII